MEIAFLLLNYLNCKNKKMIIIKKKRRRNPQS